MFVFFQQKGETLLENKAWFEENIELGGGQIATYYPPFSKKKKPKKYQIFPKNTRINGLKIR